MPSSSAVTPSSSSASAPLFKKKRARGAPSNGGAGSASTKSQPLNRSVRGQDEEEDDDDASSSSAGPSVIHKARKIDTSNPLIQSTGISLAKRRARERAAAELEDDDGTLDLDEDEYSNVSARVKAGTSNGASSRLGADATRTVDWYDEEERDGRGSTAASSLEAKNNDDGVYRGLSSYSSAVAQDPNASRSKYTQRGPIKAPTNIRTVTVVDYQPDVCKDYKETGYCGFGDTCKFLHDRSDYLAGWQMEAAYLPNSTARNLGHTDQDGEDEDDEDDDVPFACLICRQPFTDPVQTKCGHYFCSSCAIKRFAKTPKCFACGAQTGGIFNSAQKIIQRMEKRKALKDDEKRQRRAEWGDNDGNADGQILEGVEVSAAGWTDGD